MNRSRCRMPLRKRRKDKVEPTRFPLCAHLCVCVRACVYGGQRATSEAILRYTFSFLRRSLSLAQSAPLIRLDWRERSRAQSVSTSPTLRPQPPITVPGVCVGRALRIGLRSSHSQELSPQLPNFYCIHRDVRIFFLITSKTHNKTLTL